MREEPVGIVICGHVDHGKSTLIGRLLHDTGALPQSKVDAVRAVCDKRGKQMEWAFLLDAFQAERDQGITIDTSQIFFHTAQRRYRIIDAPGHHEFTKNMVTGASTADAAMLMLDAREGMREQTRRHSYLLHLMGITQVVVVITKMDLVGYDEQRFGELERDVTQYLATIGIVPGFVIPVSAQTGENVAKKSEQMPWYDGYTILEALDSFHQRSSARHLPLRMPVQDIYKFDDRRIIAGRIEAGTMRVGDSLLFSPSGKTAKITSIESWATPEKPVEAFAGQSTGFQLDTQIFIERGEIVSHADNPPKLTNVFRGRIFWFSETPMTVGRNYKMKINTTERMATVDTIERVIDTETLEPVAGTEVVKNGIADVVFRLRGMVAVDEAKDSVRTGRFVLIDHNRIVGGGIISMEGYPDQREAMQVKSTNIHAVESRVEPAARYSRAGHLGGVMWFTGLSGAGKSTLALELERQLFNKGYNVYVLDGDNVRHGLSANLGFSPDDRAENIRRVGEVAKLFAEAGFIVIAAFISPYRADRDRARETAGETFNEVYIKADVETCESRDPKGLYKKARAGEIPEFTGISAPYEEPLNAELTVDTATLPFEECVSQLMSFVDERFVKTLQAK